MGQIELFNHLLTRKPSNSVQIKLSLLIAMLKTIFLCENKWTLIRVKSVLQIRLQIMYT